MIYIKVGGLTKSFFKVVAVPCSFINGAIFAILSFSKTDRGEAFFNQKFVTGILAISIAVNPVPPVLSVVVTGLRNCC